MQTMCAPSVPHELMFHQLLFFIYYLFCAILNLRRQIDNYIVESSTVLNKIK